MPDSSPLSTVTDTLFAMIATYLAANGSRDIINDFPSIALSKNSGHRVFNFEGSDFKITPREIGDIFVAPGVNIYFGDEVAHSRKILPQIWRLPVMMHVLCPLRGEQARAAGKQAKRIGELVMNAWENLGGTFPIYDFTISPPAPVVNRFVTWATSTRGSWRDEGDPTTDDFTNRVWTMEVRYVR